PSWVKAPGNHPLVAAFPAPEVDVVESSLKVETVTVVTTDHVISEGTEKSYSTAKTEGTSNSLANTQTWNEWEEVSEATESLIQPLFRTYQHKQENETPLYGASINVEDCGYFSLARGKCRTISEDELTGQTPESCWGHDRNNDTSIGGEGGWEFLGKATVSGEQTFGTTHSEKSPTSIGCKAYIGRRYMDLPPEKLEETKQAINFYNELESGQGIQRTDSYTTVVKNQIVVDNAFDTDSIVSGLSGIQSAYRQSGQLIANKLYEIATTLAAPRITRTNAKGVSRGGSQTLEHTTYEEHTVTNGEAFSNEESWSTATAVDSAHAADLTFTYKVRNTGAEYAREIANLAFNLYIGDDPNPAYTYFVAPDIGGSGKFQNFMPNEEHQYTSRRIPLSLEQMKTIDLGGPIRIVVEDFTYGIDELFYQDAAASGVLVAMEDGTDDGDEAIDTYLIPTWGEEMVLDVLARYFPHNTDANGMLTTIWTPEYRSDTPAWCVEPQVVGSGSQRTLWCKHALSTADWW
ncbi:MAG: hypothetical protein KDE31_21715, partial [Caldilineaceae bacterium]|nr:hypothetical protein [Caldilineaceae bacterium]